MSNLALLGDEDDEVGLSPTAAKLHAVAGQVHRTQLALKRDYSHAPRLPWQSVHDLVGPLLPGTWWLLAAHTGRGKTTLAMNILTDLARQGRKVTMLALEQDQETMRQTWAAVSLGFRVSYVLEHRWGDLPPRAEQMIHDHIDWQCTEYFDHITFAEEHFLAPETLPGIVEREAKAGCELLILDHLHRLAQPTYDSVSLAAKALTEAARESGVPILATAQMGEGGRDPDPLKPYLPCELRDVYGSGVIGQETHVALGIYWPLGITTKEDLAAVRRREKEAHELAMPNTLAVRVMKHRVRGGEVVGRSAFLKYEHGRIVDPETERINALEERESDFTLKHDDEPPLIEPMQEDMWEDGRE